MRASRETGNVEFSRAICATIFLLWNVPFYGKKKSCWEKRARRVLGVVLLVGNVGGSVRSLDFILALGFFCSSKFALRLTSIYIFPLTRRRNEWENIWLDTCDKENEKSDFSCKETDESREKEVEKVKSPRNEWKKRFLYFCKFKFFPFSTKCWKIRELRRSVLNLRI